MKAKAKAKANALKVGDLVELLVDVVPYYSGYAGNPKVLITKGTIGRIGAVNVPPVRGNGANFLCVDFNKIGFVRGAKNPSVVCWRAAVPYSGVKRFLKIR